MAETYRIRRNWKRAAKCWRGPFNPTKHHQELLELIFAIGGPALQRAYDEFRADPRGQKLLRDKPVITDVLLDDDYLRSLPLGSLGHAYYDFMQQNRLDAALYTEAGHLRPIADRLGWDDDFYYVAYRGLVAHDLFHVVGGYGPDVGGEIGVVAFTHGQARNIATGSLKWVMQLNKTGVPRKRLRQQWNESIRRAEQADSLMVQPFEELMAEPLDEVRVKLGLVPLTDAHPDGVLYLPFQFGAKRDQRMAKAFDPYVYDPTRNHAAA